MNADGYKQVERLRDRLTNEKIDAVYSSDLRRALVTAEVISSGRKVDIVTCPELREIDYGNADGLSLKEISRLYPEVAESISNFSLQLKFPGGESFEGFIERISKFMEKLEKHAPSERISKSMEEKLEKYAPSETILIVSHSGPLKVLVCRLLGVDLGHWGQIGCANASLSIAEMYPDGAMISLLNDTCHLREIG